MCGFGGVINHPDGVNTRQLSTAASTVNFRGPDSCGIRILNDQLNQAEHGPHGVFFNRLAIIDLDKRSDQPFENEKYLLVFNGEIYNYQQLRCELQKSGRTFTTTSDTEVLFHALQEWGSATLKKLNGMFAFFWLDKEQRKFVIARDRLGIKPLYYHYENSSLYYASELTTIVRLQGKPAVVDSDAIDMFLWLQYIPTPYTAVRGIKKLAPGHYLEGSLDHSSNSNPQQYWDAYDYVSQVKEPQQTSLEEVLRNSLERQLHADVPLGLFLSSGVDSSLLAAMVNKYFSAGGDVNFFTVRFEETTTSDESESAREFIAGFNNANLRCHTITVSPSTLAGRVENLYHYYDEPFGDHASLLNWMISEKARDHVTVAISGDGADELFWGYPRYDRWQQFGKMSRTPFLSDVARITSSQFPGKMRNNSKFVLERDPVKRHFNLFLPSGMRFKINDHITRHPMWCMNGIQKVSNRNDLPSVIDIKGYLADAMLYKVDRSSMASSLEVRVPYLDNDMVDLALAMPLDEKSNAEFRNKAPLKQLLSQLAPHYSLNHRKKGFSFPLRTWLKHSWKDLVLSTVAKDTLESAGLRAEPYLRLVNNFYASKNDYFTDVWYIFNLSLWMNRAKTTGIL